MAANCNTAVLAPIFVAAVIIASLVRSSSVASPGLPLRPIGPDIPLSGGASRFDYQSIDPSQLRLYIAHLGASMVTVFDLKGGRVVANITDVSDVHGVLAVPGLQRVFATASGRNQVAVISEEDNRVIARVPAGVYPDGMAYDPNTHRLYVSDESGATETVIDTRTNRRLATIDLGGEAGNAQYDPAAKQILVDVQTRDQIVAIDPRTDRIAARYRLPDTCVNDHSLLIGASARLAFVACDGNARLLLFDLRTHTVRADYTVGDGPDVLAFDQGLSRLYVSSESGIVSVFALDGKRLHLLGQALLAPGAHTVAVDQKTHRVYFPLQNVDGRPVLRITEPTS